MQWNRAELRTLAALDQVFMLLDAEKKVGGVHASPDAAKVIFAAENLALVVYFTDEAAATWEALRVLSSSRCEAPI